jgi:hypothetical protein
LPVRRNRRAFERSGEAKTLFVFGGEPVNNVHTEFSIMRLLAVLIAFTLTLTGQTGSLNLVIVEGEGAINNIRQRTAREPIVQVEDENHKPIAGAAVVFSLPSNGAGGTFANGGLSMTTTTDNAGRAVARGLRPNQVAGNYQIRVTASQGGRTASAVISQSNVIGAGAAAGAATAAGISGKLIAVIAAVGAAAAAGGIVAATRNGNNNAGAGGVPSAATTVAAGAGTVGPPR